MSCLKCRNEIYDNHTQMCKKHFYNRKQKYVYAGHKVKTVQELVQRQCLHCDKKFMSTGNRRCDYCNSVSDCQYESNLSLYAKC